MGLEKISTYTTVGKCMNYFMFMLKLFYYNNYSTYLCLCVIHSDRYLDGRKHTGYPTGFIVRVCHQM